MSTVSMPPSALPAGAGTAGAQAAATASPVAPAANRRKPRLLNRLLDLDITISASFLEN